MLDEARAALERGRAVMFVTPPAPEQARAVWDLLGAPADSAERPVLIICADPGTARQWAARAPDGWRVHAVSGITRSIRILRDKKVAPSVVAGSLADLTALVTRSALKLDSVSTVIVAWPEPLVAGEQSETLDTLL